MSRETIVLDHLNGQEAAARLVAGRLEDLLIDGGGPRIGTIYRAIAERPVKGQGGMFLRTPDGPAFLRQVRGIAPGQALLVQVTGQAEPGKALPVTQKLLFKSRYAIVTPGAPGLNISRAIRDDERRDMLLQIARAERDEIGEADLGLILRSSCADAAPDVIAEDIRAMTDLAAAVLGDAEGAAEVLTEGDGPHQMAWREWSAPADIVTEAGGFDAEGVLDQIALLQTAHVSLPGSASMYVEPTRALIAVDVNTGADTSPAAGHKANIAAARELPRQLRLRGLGGQIVLDLAPMAKKDRRQFEDALRAAFRADMTETALVGWTPLGHYELQRKRDRAILEVPS
ncbi:ribonuclease G [Pelagivirga sediminicola]|uniref:Ribonuclease G n=1 Tax=Pelagivirga sediminicola TaxID=2170575 RepID=A0A2T7G7T0_9RHOB|nr:ribonuclease E/G [Pelagivirga sediminicola]PVA10483.1 ribonuclease G [Pelagivirga sediminicola]